MKKIILVPVLILLIVISSCSSIKVTADYDNTTNFEAYKTFTLLPWNKHNDSIVSPFTKQRIMESLKNEMIKRGYSFVEDMNKAELGINSFILMREKTDYQYYQNSYRPYGFFYGNPWAWGGYYGNPYGTRIQKHDYVEGTLIIDVFDTHQKKLIWQGIGVGEVSPNSGNKNISKVVEQILFKYPVKYKK